MTTLQESDDSDDSSDDDQVVLKHAKKRRVRHAPDVSRCKSSQSRRKQWQQFLKQEYTLQVPPHVLSFWDMCYDLDPTDPSKPLVDAGLHPTGMLHALLGKLDGVGSDVPLHVHGKHHFDTPEFMPLLTCAPHSMLHWGLWYDSPSQPSTCVVKSNTAQGAEVKFGGESLFAAVHAFLQKPPAFTDQQGAAILKQAMADKAKEDGVSMVSKPSASASHRKRQKQVVTKTFHKFGLVVPYNQRADVGYRDLGCSDRELKGVLGRMAKSKDNNDTVDGSKLEETLTYVNYADDEGDPGMGLELGVDLYCHGHAMFSAEAARLCKRGYNAVKKPLFAAIAAAHLSRRSGGGGDATDVVSLC